METVVRVKQRVGELVEQNRELLDQLAEVRRHAQRMQRERDDAARELAHCEQEGSVARQELLRERQRFDALLAERESLIVELDAERQDLHEAVAELRGELSHALDQVERYAERLKAASRERDAALSELGEASCAFVDIREKLQTSLDAVDAPEFQPV